jgi:hypothetical protein
MLLPKKEQQVWNFGGIMLAVETEVLGDNLSRR